MGVLGILGNIISIVVLTSRDMQNSFNLLLSCLATIDIVFIIIAVLDYSLARGSNTTCQIELYRWKVVGAFYFLYYKIIPISLNVYFKVNESIVMNIMSANY